MIQEEKEHTKIASLLNSVNEWIDSDDFGWEARDKWSMYSDNCYSANIRKEFYFKGSVIDLEVRALYRYHEVHDIYEPVNYELFDIMISYDDHEGNPVTTDDMYALEAKINDKI